MATVSQQIQEIYVGLLGRAADKAGLAYWTNEITNGTLTIEQLRANIVNEQPEYASTLGSMTRAQVVAELYNRLFERAPEADGLEYWVNGAGKDVNVDQLVLALSNGANATDRLTLDNKVEAAEYFSANIADGKDTNSAAQAAVDSVDGTAASVAASKTSTDNGGGSNGTSFTLTTGVDSLTGTENNDTFNAIIDGTTGDVKTTLNALDTVNGGAGTDTLNIDVANGTGGAGTAVTALPTVSLSNVETVGLRSAVDLTADVSSWTGVTTVNSTLGKATNLTAATTTDVNVSGSTGAIVVNGGKDITVSDATKDTDITIGATTVNDGNITVTATDVGTTTIAVDGGKDVSITATGSTGGADEITVGRGGAATDLASGNIVVTSNAASKAATDETLADIKVSGGTTVTVNQVATSTAAAADKTGATATMGAVEVDAGDATTTVTVTQTAATAEVVAVDAVAGVATTQTITFKALAAGENATILFDGGDSVTFTAAKNLTAAEVAAAFANLASGDTEGSAPNSNGVYTTAGTIDQGWTSGAVTNVDSANSSVTFSNVAAAPTALNNTGSTGGKVTVAAAANGTAEVKAVTGVQGVTVDSVTIDDNATASITTVTVDGYANSTIGATTATTKLATLNLANAAAAVTMTVADTAETLALTTEKLGTSAGDAVLTLTAAPKTLNVTSTGDNYVNLTANATETLTVTGTGTLDADATDLQALKTVTVSGSAGLKLNAGVANTVTSINTSATTGAVTATINGTAATYTGGAGVDNVTLDTGTALTKAIDLGAGDDSVTFGAAVTGSTAALNGGEGTDTVVMSIANAAALDATAQTFYTNFERLTINNAYNGGNADTQDTETLDLANLGLASYVTTSGTLIDGSDRAGESDILALTKLAANATVVLTADGLITASLADATGTSDVINIAMSSDGATTGGNFTVANVETVNISVNDVVVDANNDGKDDTNAADTLTLTAADATKIDIGGSADLALTLTGSTKATTIDASDMTGVLTVTTLDTASGTTVTGGAGNDVLTSADDGDTLIGGAGNDTLTVNAGADLVTLTGGAGNDTFVFAAPTTVNSYATITDLSAGDVIDMANGVDFISSAIKLGDTAVFQDYANAAVNATDANNESAWFQFAGNTYIVTDAATGGAAFADGTDSVIKITGLVDLSTAVYNETNGTLEIA